MRQGSNPERGFSMLELLAVVSIMAVVAAMATPSMLTTVGHIRARSSAESVAGLMQKARAQAARDNRYYSVVPDTSSGVTRECVDTNWNGACNSGEFDVQLARSVQFISSGGPSTALITCGTLGPTTCPTGWTSGLNFNPQARTVLPSFNARALPCVNNPPSTQPVWPNVICNTTDVSQPSPPPVGFLYVLQYNGILTPSYSAVAITPAGRITVWTYTGRDSNGNDVWTP